MPGRPCTRKSGAATDPRQCPCRGAPASVPPSRGSNLTTRVSFQWFGPLDRAALHPLGNPKGNTLRIWSAIGFIQAGASMAAACQRCCQRSPGAPPKGVVRGQRHLTEARVPLRKREHPTDIEALA